MRLRLPSFRLDAIFGTSDFVNDLYSIWRLHATTSVGDEPTIQILTWYLAPGRELHRCLEPRPVRLAADFAQWE